MMKLAHFPIVLLVSFLVLVSSASAQKKDGGGKDNSGRGGERPATNAPQGGGGNAANGARESTRSNAPRATSPAQRNVERPKVAAPADGNRNGANRSNVQRGTGARDNVGGTVNKPRRDDARQNDSRLGTTRPDDRTAPRNRDHADVRVTPRTNINPRVNATGPNAWRYRQYNNQWWYWLPNNTWVFWNNGAWVPQGGLAGPGYSDQPYVSGYRGPDVAAGAYLGVSFDSRYTDAAVISRVNANSPAEAVGLQPGDVIRAIDGNEVTSLHEPSNIIGRSTPGTEIKLSIERGGQLMDVPVVLAER